jgi:hypothetical protein
MKFMEDILLNGEILPKFWNPELIAMMPSSRPYDKRHKPYAIPYQMQINILVSL